MTSHHCFTSSSRHFLFYREACGSGKDSVVSVLKTINSGPLFDSVIQAVKD